MLNIAVIGAGGVGSATARFLARDGHNVTVYEQFTLDHDKGSSYGGSRIIRRTYPDPLYTHMMGSAYDLWAELEEDAGDDLFVRCGGLTFGHQNNPIMAQTEQSLRVNAVPYKRLTAVEVMRRFPAFQLEQDMYGIFQTDSGFLRASECVKAQMRLACSDGAMLIENTPVQSVRRFADGRIGIVTAGGEIAFDRLLITAGPWMTRLLPSLNLPLTVTRQYYAHLYPKTSADDFAVGKFPVWIDVDTNMYGFPEQPEWPGVKIACHEHGMTTNPENVVREPSASDLSPLLANAGRRLPTLQGPPIYGKICLYTNTPDEDFIVDAVPDLPGAFFCSGCSGHGFKFTILLGQILARLADGDPVSHNLSRFALSRFGAETSPIVDPC